MALAWSLGVHLRWLRHHLDRLWKPISFNKVYNLLLLFLWCIFLSTSFILHSCVCLCMCVWVWVCLCVFVCVCAHVHVLINLIGEWFDVVSAWGCHILWQFGHSINLHNYDYLICVGVFAFDYHLLGSVGKEIFNPSFDLASESTEVQLQQETLVWDLVKGFWEVQ